MLFRSDSIQKEIEEASQQQISDEKKLENITSVINRAAEAKKKLEEKRNNLQVLEKSLEEKKSSIELIERQLSYLEETLKEQDDLLKKLEEKESLLKKSRELESKINNAKSVRAGNEVKRAQNERIEKEKKECDDQISKLSAEINEKDAKIKNLKGCLDVFQRDFPNFIVLRACSDRKSVV